MTLAQAPENSHVLQTVSLLTAYCFDLRGLAPTQLINEWLRTFSALWIRLAVVEALYLGRYKAISVEHLLEFWKVKGQPNFHFSSEFEQMISQRLPKSLTPIAEVVEAPPSLPSPVGRGKMLKVPGVIKQNSAAVTASPDSFSPPLIQTPERDHPLLDSPIAEVDSVPECLGETPAVLTKPSTPPTRHFSPSIEQFIPIAVESDLLSKLQSVLNQNAVPGKN